MTLQSSSKTSWKLSDPISSWNVRGPVRKQNIPKVTAGKTKPRLISSLLLCPGSPFLPRREWARGAWLHVLTACPDCAENRRAVHVYKHHIIYRRIAVQPSPAGPFPTRVCAAQTLKDGWSPGRCPYFRSCHPMWLWQSIGPQGSTEYQPLFSTCSFSEMLKCGEIDKAELQQKGKVIKETPTHWSGSLESDMGIRRLTGLK